MSKLPSFKDIVSAISETPSKSSSSKKGASKEEEPEAEEEYGGKPRAFLVISRNCSNCDKLIERRDFKELLKLVDDIAVDEEAYIMGADFTYSNILQRTLGYDTPAVVLGDDVIPYTKLLDLLYAEKRAKGRVSSILNVIRRSSSKSGGGAERATSSKKSKSRTPFIEKQEMKRKFTRASLGSCEGNVCREQ